VVALDPVVGVPVSAVPGRGQQRLQHGRVDRRLVGGDLGGHDLGRADRLLEESAGGVSVSSGGHEHVDDLAELVDRPVGIASPAGDLDVGLIHKPAISHGVSAGAGGVGQQRREPHHPALDGDVVDLDPALREELFNVAVGQPKA
jgi:hypothetical protein